MAEALGEMGCKLAISARKQHELDAASAAHRRTNIDVLTIANDLGAATADAAASLVGAVLDHYGKIDILVKNAGTVWGALGHRAQPRSLAQGDGAERRCVFSRSARGRAPLDDPQ